MQKWIEECPNEFKFNKELEDQRQRIEDLELTFDEQRIKDQLKRILLPMIS